MLLPLSICARFFGICFGLYFLGLSRSEVAAHGFGVISTSGLAAALSMLVALALPGKPPSVLICRRILACTSATVGGLFVAKCAHSKGADTFELLYLVWWSIYLLPLAVVISGDMAAASTKKKRRWRQG